MDGLSIKEAATILGVPKGRVWELIARGVLVGTPEAGGMRVYLHGKRAEVVPAPQVEAADERPQRPGGNGNGNGGVHEASPFREILTEFRNLTERYGQALLALGEARGEVAALRSRVELLEARIDLRLPPAPPFVSWNPPQEAVRAPEPGPAPEPAPAPEQPTAPEPMTAGAAPEPAATPVPESPIAPEPMTSEAAPEARAPEPMTFDAGLEPEIEPDIEPAPVMAEESILADAEPEAPPRPRAKPRIRPRHRRRPSRRAAMEGIAMALARAEDPSAAELPGAEEAGVAFAAYQASVDDEGAEPELQTEEDDLLAPMDSVATSEPIPDAFLGDDALGGLVIEEEALEPEPSVIGQAVAEESEEKEPGIEAMESSRETPSGEQTMETPVYSSEWDEPDWIAEEDLDTWDLASQPAVSDAPDAPAVVNQDVPVELGEAAAPPEPPMTAEATDAGEFVTDAIEDAFAEPALAPDEPALAPDELTSADVGPAAASAESMPDDANPDSGENAADMASAADDSTEFAASAIENAWSEAEPVHDGAVPEAPVDVAEAEAEPSSEIPTAEPEATAEPPASEPENALDAHADEAEQVDPLMDDEIFPKDPTEVMNALVESGVALPESEPIVAQASAEPPAEPEAEPPFDKAPPAQEPSVASVNPAEEELMWLGDEFSPDHQEGWRSAAASPPITPAEDRALNKLAAERGWDDGELRAIRSLLAPPTTEPLESTTETAASEGTDPDMPAADAPTASADVPAADLSGADVPAAEPPPPGQPESAAQGQPEMEAQAALDAGPGIPPNVHLVAEPDVLEPEDEVMDWEQSPSAWTPPAPTAPSGGAAVPAPAGELPGAADLAKALASFSRQTPQGSAEPPTPDASQTDQGNQPDAPTPEPIIGSTSVATPPAPVDAPSAVETPPSAPETPKVANESPQVADPASQAAAVPPSSDSQPAPREVAPASTEDGRGHAADGGDASDAGDAQPTTTFTPGQVWSKPAIPVGMDEPQAPPTSSVEPPSPQEPSDRRDDEDWLAGRRGPAANAYRRLRRLFPR